MASETGREAFEGWAILELMGHRKLAGYVREVEMFGAALCRIDVPAGDDDAQAVTQFYTASAVYCMTPTTEAVARRMAPRFRPAPVGVFELPAPKPVIVPERFRSPADDDDDEPQY
jgi:hypothetical protein